MSQLLKVLFVYLFVLFTSLPIQAESEKGLLWEISGSQTIKSSYLFATIHVDHEKVLNLPKKVESTFNAADSFSGEVILDKKALSEISNIMWFDESQNLKSHLTAKQYQQCLDIMSQRGVTEQMLNRLKPWAIATVMSTPISKSDFILDKHLFIQADKQDKAIYGLETVTEQLSAFINMPLKDQVEMLNESIKLNPIFNTLYEEILTAYLAGDLSELLRLDKKYQNKSNPKLENYLRVELLEKRNIRMLKRMQARLKEGNAFIAVGALHLPGDSGLIKLLRQQGYTVKSVY